MSLESRVSALEVRVELQDAEIMRLREWRHHFADETTKALAPLWDELNEATALVHGFKATLAAKTDDGNLTLRDAKFLAYGAGLVIGVGAAVWGIAVGVMTFISWVRP